MIEMKQDQKIVQKLVSSNFEFKQLHREHETLENKINEITKQKFVSDKEDKLRKELQKKKLSGRDRMEEILREFQASL